MRLLQIVSTIRKKPIYVAPTKAVALQQGMQPYSDMPAQTGSYAA